MGDENLSPSFMGFSVEEGVLGFRVETRLMEPERAGKAEQRADVRAVLAPDHSWQLVADGTG